MKIAVCMSGHIRNLELHFSNFQTNIMQPYKPDIFLHTWDTYGWCVQGNDLELKEGGFKGFDHYSAKVNQENLISILKPASYVFENFLTKQNEFFERGQKFKERLRVPDLDRPENTIGMAYKVYECNKLKKDYEQANNFTYDLVIRTRPDLLYLNKPLIFSFLDLIKKDILITPNESSYGFASDIFALGNSKIIDKYSELYLHFEELYNEGCLFNPHNISQHYFNKYFNWIIGTIGIDLDRQKNN
jgi:hypothetical protein